MRGTGEEQELIIRGEKHCLDVGRGGGLRLIHEGHSPIDIELEEGEYIQLLVTASDGRTCVLLGVVNGMLEIVGGASIISSIEGDGMAELVGCLPAETAAAMEMIGPKRSILALRAREAVIGDAEAAILYENGIRVVADLADWTYDGIEALVGPNCATKLQDWLKTIDLSLKC